MTLKGRISRIVDSAICLARKTWRPFICAELAVTVGVNMIYLPLKAGKAIEFAPAAAFVTAIVGAFAVREIGKIKGSAE